MFELLNELNEHRKMLNECIAKKKDLGRKLAKAEFIYKVERSKMIAHLNIIGLEISEGVTKPIAITACEAMSHGLEPVATLRRDRDLAKMDYDVLQEKIYQCKLEIGIIERQIMAERKGE